MDVVALNNQAVSGYQAGYHREALTAFTKILLFLQSQGRRPCEEEPTDENQRLAAFAVTAMPLSDEPMSRFGSLFPSYSRPFCLLDSNNEEEDPAEMDANWRLSEKDEMLQFAVVTYNAALAHHALAIRQAGMFRQATIVPQPGRAAADHQPNSQQLGATGNRSGSVPRYEIPPCWPAPETAMEGKTARFVVVT